MQNTSARSTPKTRSERAPSQTGLIHIPTVRESELRWRVNWAAVERYERWLHGQGLMLNERRTIATREVGGLLYAAVVEVPHEQAEGGLVLVGPENARTIHGVLLSGCAGYSDPPRAEDVVAGIEAEQPNDAQGRAVCVFLTEASRYDIRRAWKRGEFKLSNLMRTVERIIGPHHVPRIRKLREWVNIEGEG